MFRSLIHSELVFECDDEGTHLYVWRSCWPVLFITVSCKDYVLASIELSWHRPFVCLLFLLWGICTFSFFSFLFFFFPGPHLQHMGVPRLRIESELQLLTYVAACGSARSLTPWSRPGFEPTSSRTSLTRWATMGTPIVTQFNSSGNYTLRWYKHQRWPFSCSSLKHHLYDTLISYLCVSFPRLT